MEFIKNQKKGFILYAIVAVLTVISLIIYILNVNAAYYDDMNGNVVVLIVLALVALVGSMVLSKVSGSKVVSIAVDLLRIASAVLIIASAGAFIGMRVESFGYIYGSNLELGNDEAFSAGGQAITGIGLMVVTWLLAVVAAFLKIGKKDA